MLVVSNFNYLEVYSMYSDVSLFIAILSLFIAMGVAWFSVLRPSKIVGDLTYIGIKQFSSKRDGVVTKRLMVPKFWLRNIGARAKVVKDIRFSFVIDERPPVYIYPTHAVTKEIIDGTHAGDNDFNQPGAPFSGFVLTKDELWENNYVFNLKKDVAEKMIGQGICCLEIKPSSGGWEKVILNHHGLTNPEFVSTMKSNVGSIFSYIYPDRYQDRKNEED